MAYKQPSGCAYLSTTEGTGDIALNGGTVAGYTSIVAKLATNDTSRVRVQMGTTWEHLAVTRLASPDRLRVDAVIGTSTGGTDKIDWTAGTKTVTVVPVGELTPALGQENPWGADQHFGGYKVTLNAGKTTWRQASTQSGEEVEDLYVNGKFTVRTKVGEIRLFSDDAGASAGPTLVLDRGSASPTAGDDLGGVSMRGRNNAAETVVYGFIETRIVGASDGSENGEVVLGSISSGSMQDQLFLAPGRIYVPADMPLYIGKDTASSATKGHEFRANGSAFHTGDGEIPLYLDYKGASGSVTMLQFRRSNSNAGSIVSTATTISFAQPSDERLKTQIKPYTGFAEFLDSLQVMEWLWAASGLPGRGCIAQWLQKTRPDLVYKDENGILHAMYGLMIPDLLAEAVDGRRRERALEARLARLEAKLAAGEASE